MTAEQTRRSLESDGQSRLVALLAATTVGAYLLLIAGATATVADAAAACPTWPTCQGQLVPDLSDPRLAVAWGHRVAALLVGGAVLATGWTAWRAGAERRVLAALAGVVALYPVQVRIGAITVTEGPTAGLSAVHLLVGVGIFGGLLVALAWTLEPDDAEAADRDSRPGPSPDAAPDASTDAAADGPSRGPPATTAERLGRRVRAYVRLTKPRLMWLLCLVAAAAMALAAGPRLDPGTVVATLVGGVLAIGASGTFNHVLERDVDRRMNRTSDRPLATDEVGVRNAVAFGFALAAGALVAFASINWLAALLGASAIVFYSVVYTLVLKPNTVQNTVIGGAAGALPALIGWAAVTGRVGLPAVLLAGVIFLWTPAHFYNLALAYREDYARAGFPMLPVVRGAAVARKHILLYLGATLVAAVALVAATPLGIAFAATSTTLGAVFLWAVVRLHRERTEAAAMRSFHASNAYLGAVLVAVVVDAMVV